MRPTLFFASALRLAACATTPDTSHHPASALEQICTACRDFAVADVATTQSPSISLAARDKLYGSAYARCITSWAGG